MSWKAAGSFAPLSRLWGTLAFRLTAWYALSAVILVFAATGSLYLVLLTELEGSNDLFLADKRHVLTTMLRERPNDEDGLREEIELETAARLHEHFYIRLLDAARHAALTTPGMAEQLDLDRLTRETEAHPGRTISLTGRNGQDFRAVNALAPVGNSPTRIDTIQIAIDVSSEDGLLARYRLWLLGILIASLIVCPLAGYEIARRGIHPLAEIAATARRIGSSNLRERIVDRGYPSELKSLADTFNQMLARLEESFDRISRFSADIAHDLRTPVNNIRGEAEVALSRARPAEEYREVLESCLEESVRLSDLISNLLFLARTEDPIQHLHRESVDLSALLNRIQEYYAGPAAEAGVSLIAVASPESVVAGLDRTLLQRAVGNLVANAVAHTPRGGRVELAANRKGNNILIEVRDTGTGISPEDLPKVFDRFFRSDASRTRSSGGAGLGLSIVRGIMLLHGGEAQIESSLGIGTTVTLRLPHVIDCTGGRQDDKNVIFTSW